MDLQLNGYRGVDFNSTSLTAEELHLAAEALIRDGCGECLPTIITDAIEVMEAKIRKLALAMESDLLVRQVMKGIHVEGPFINPQAGYHGAHPQKHAHLASADEAIRLVEAGLGHVRLLTLAPEMDPGFAATKRLVAAGIRVSAGHCNPSSQTLREAVEAGVSLFTHLGNGCPALLPRHDNIIQRVLAQRALPWVMFIADGVHVPCEALGNYFRCVGLERVVVVTDGTSAAGMGPGRYQLSGIEVLVDASGAAWSPDRSHLIGSTITMPETRRLLMARMGLTAEEVDQVTLHNPLRAVWGKANGSQ
jgi:N-acetylglucosamine-6-phosphate deacetylase